MYKHAQSVDEIIKESRNKAVFVLKHSNACPISFAAKEEVDSFLEKHPETVCFLVVVQEQRDVSNALEEKLGVKRNSPQLVCIKDGKATRVANHYDITEELLKDLT